MLLHHHGVIPHTLTALVVAVVKPTGLRRDPSGEGLLFPPLKAVLQSHQTEMPGALVPGCGGPVYLCHCPETLLCLV
jgi:hypothetical protein